MHSRPKDLLRNSIVTPSLEAAILNGKYVNSIPLYRMEQEFQRNGVFISRQNMADWTILCAQRYLYPLYERMKEELLSCHVIQCDETSVEVVNDGRGAGAQSYMWVHRSGEYYKDRQVVLYEYQKTRAHARRDFSDAVKAMADPETAKQSTAYQALLRISSIYKLDESLKALSARERLRERQKSVKPLVDEYFAWVKSMLASQLPKSKTTEGLRYSINQEKYLRVFLEDDEVPIDNSASERSIRTFCIGKKNWVLIDSIKGAQASAVIYSISETAKLNNLNTYNYFCHLLTELPKLAGKNGNIDIKMLDPLLPWADALPEKCHRPRR